MFTHTRVFCPVELDRHTLMNCTNKVVTTGCRGQIIASDLNAESGRKE